MRLVLFNGTKAWPNNERSLTDTGGATKYTIFLSNNNQTLPRPVSIYSSSHLNHLFSNYQIIKGITIILDHE